VPAVSAAKAKSIQDNRVLNFFPGSFITFTSI
jgi:hypothetical protein